MDNNFKCKHLDTFDSATVNFDFCGLCYTACATHCKYYGRCLSCDHNKDLAFCLSCSRREENKKAE